METHGGFDIASGEWTRSDESARGAAHPAACVGAAVMLSTALAGPVPDYDSQRATFGAVGNSGLHPGPDDGGVAAGSDSEVGGQLPGTVTMGDQLQGPIAIEHDGRGAAGALVGQVVINASDTSHTWDDQVTIGSNSPVIVLGPGQSGDNAAPDDGVGNGSIGGRAVGLVPFGFHRKDSAPNHDATWLVDPADLNEDAAADAIDLLELLDAVVNGAE